MYRDIPQQSEISENLFHNITNANIIRPNKIYLSCLFEIDSQSKKKKKKKIFSVEEKMARKKGFLQLCNYTQKKCNRNIIYHNKKSVTGFFSSNLLV